VFLPEEIAKGRQHTATVARSPRVDVQDDTAMWKAIAAVAVGSSLGGLLRWWLSVRLNAQFLPIPPGTLASNLIGGYLVGIAVAFFATYPTLSPEWRLLVITGFCGGLTTFSSFSAEVITQFQLGRGSWALAAIAVHLIGSLLMTLAGIGTVVWARS
jgi:CrcB protein